MKRKKPSKGSGSPSFANPEIGQIEQLLRFMSEHNLEEFEYSRGDLRIRLKKPGSSVVYAAARPSAEIIVPSAVLAGPAESAPQAEASVRGGEDLHLVKSPIVGTFYGSPSPGAEPFVKVGVHVDAGQTLCIVEAMKLMNEIESEVSGEVLRIFAENGQPVEYGQPLFGIRPSRKR
ncbi:MAG TPA: acetyl-CoA carboxylase biotin carboxyl carrier protein [Candidatus Acidoferrum sp.]|jgi:acetyl-CoA carboxylase biotin carboxyl carrier protein|nr:acetyl-CoA carboxylase biotin carboxyl carrier protein [Candidatus Acidoferrum sp.]